MASELVPIDMTDEMFVNLKELIKLKLKTEVDAISFELFEEKDPTNYDELATIIGEVKINAYFAELLREIVDNKTVENKKDISWQDQED